MEKMEILKRLDDGEPPSTLAKEYDVGRTTVHDIKKKRIKIMEHIIKMSRVPGKRKTMKAGDCPEMETALNKWFIAERAKGTTITKYLLKTKAIALYKTITNREDFAASDGWIYNFKKRFGIRFTNL